MIAIPIQGVPSIIQSVITKFIYFDILFTEIWMPNFFHKIGLDTEGIKDDEPVNSFFDEIGFKSK